MATGIEQLRDACLSRDGDHGIRRLARLYSKDQFPVSRFEETLENVEPSFNVIDESGNHQLDRDEFGIGLDEFGMNLPKSAVDDLFREFDREGSGTISFDEFLQKLRPPMSQARVAMIKKAFDKLDSTNAGVITLDDLRATYSVEQHPKFISGEMTQDQILQEFMSQFEEGQRDGQITFVDWLNYYSGVSASIDDDQYFVDMMQNAWQIQ